MEKKSELRRTDNVLLRRIQRQMDKETQISPFIPTETKEDLMVLKEELETSPEQLRRTRLSLFENNSRSRGR